MKGKIYIMANKAAIDAAMLTKDKAVDAFSRQHNVPLEMIAAIGDEAIDLPMLTTKGLGLAGTPANGQEKVKEHVSGMGNGIVLPSPGFDGFLEFYSMARKKGITHIISDKDGVLVEKGKAEKAEEFIKLAYSMGCNGNPFVSVLTGSGVSQNTKFRQQFGLDARLGVNPAISRHPYLLVVESGAIHVNVLTEEKLNYCRLLDQELLGKLKGPFQEQVLSRLEKEVLPAMGLVWSEDYDDQAEKVYVAPKESMLTINVPRAFKDGSDYRKSRQADELRKATAAIMVQAAQSVGAEYEII